MALQTNITHHVEQWQDWLHWCPDCCSYFVCFEQAKEELMSSWPEATDPDLVNAILHAIKELSPVHSIYVGWITPANAARMPFGWCRHNARVAGLEARLVGGFST